MEGLTRRVGIVALGRAASTLSIFVVYAVLSRAWDQAEFGLFNVVWVLGNTLVPVFLLGLPTALLYFFPHSDGRGRGRLVLQGLSCLILSGALLTGVLWGGGELLAGLLRLDTGGTVELGRYLIPFLPYVFALVAGGLIEPSLVAAGHHRRAAWLALATAAAQVGLAWGGRAWGLDAPQVLAGFSAVGLVRAAVGLALVGRVVDWRGARGAGPGLRAYLAYARPIGLNDAVGALSRSVDRFVIYAFFTVETFGLYNVGAVEIPVSLLLAALVAVMVPEVSRLYRSGDLAGIARLWQQAVQRLALVVLPLFALLFALAEPLIALYLDQAYARTEWVFRIFLLALPLRCAVYNPLLVGMGKARWALWGGLVDLVLNALFSLGLVLALQGRGVEWAFVGPAVATVVATYVQVGLLLGMIGRHLEWGLDQLLPWSSLGRLAAGAALGGAVAWWAAGLVEIAWIRLLVGGGAFAAVWALFLGCSRPERRALGQVVRSLRGH